MASLDDAARWVTESAAVYRSTDSIVRVTGDDGTSWLNGQVTNDVRALRMDVATYALATTVKGRVISDLWARAGTEGPVLSIPAAARERLLANLEKHIIMEDVELSEARDLCLISVQGPKALEVVAGLEQGRDIFGCARLHSAGIDIVCATTEADAFVHTLVERARALGGGALSAEGLAHAHIVGAIPRVGVDFGDSTYPQEAGLKGRAVSFNKGCYTGQEVVYMLENRGQLSRRLVQLTGPAAPALTTGAPLFDAQGQRVGEVTSATVTQGAGATTTAMAYLKRPVAEVGTTVAAGTTEGAAYLVRVVVGVTNDPCPIVAS